jgi:hypothetical protein
MYIVKINQGKLIFDMLTDINVSKNNKDELLNHNKIMETIKSVWKKCGGTYNTVKHLYRYNSTKLVFYGSETTVLEFYMTFPAYFEYYSEIQIKFEKIHYYNFK